MYRTWAWVCGVITALMFLGYCSLALMDPESQFTKDYGYTFGLLSLPFCCGVAPVTAVLTIVFAVLARTQAKP